jgi:sortase B
MFIMFFLVFIGSGGTLALRTYQDWHDAQVFAGLNMLVTEPTIPGETIPGEHQESEPLEIPDQTQPVPEETLPPQGKQILARYRTVYEMNQDMYGWISIEGLPFSYPVMLTPEDEEYYLRRGFDGAYARSGVPFIDTDCFEGCGNYVIYGHNMTNGTMFAQLFAYEDEAFWKEHPVIRFDTLYEMGEYEVIAVFYSRVFYKYESNKFRFYEYTDLTDPDRFSEYVGEVLDLSLYDTGVDARYGDELITLITCSYEHRIENERFVVVARKHGS